MEMQIVGVYFMCDEIVKQGGWKDDPQCKMSTAEVITSVLISSMYFSGNHYLACRFLHEHGYIPNMLSKSRWNRRLHAIPEEIWNTIFAIFAEAHQDVNIGKQYVVDSFPIAVCQNIRIWNSRIFQGEDFRGYIASKKQYFYGVKVHMIVTEQGWPVEFTIAPGSENDIKIFKEMRLDLPAGSVIYGDKAYNDYTYEDLASEAADIRIIPQRKSNSRRQISMSLNSILNKTRKKVETAFSCITQRFPKAIHAVTSKGFELKIISFILAYSIQPLLA